MASHQSLVFLHRVVTVMEGDTQGLGVHYSTRTAVSLCTVLVKTLRGDSQKHPFFGSLPFQINTHFYSNFTTKRRLMRQIFHTLPNTMRGREERGGRNAGAAGSKRHAAPGRGSADGKQRLSRKGSAELRAQLDAVSVPLQPTTARSPLRPPNH